MNSSLSWRIKTQVTFPSSASPWHQPRGTPPDLGVHLFCIFSYTTALGSALHLQWAVRSHTYWMAQCSVFFRLYLINCNQYSQVAKVFQVPLPCCTPSTQVNTHFVHPNHDLTARIPIESQYLHHQQQISQAALRYHRWQSDNGSSTPWLPFPLKNKGTSHPRCFW